MSKTIVDRVRERAREKDLTVKEVGIVTGIGANSIYRWDKQKPNLETLMKVAELLGVSLDYLAYGNDTNKCSIKEYQK